MHPFSFLFPVFLLIGSLQLLQLAPTSLTFQNPVDFNKTNISDTPCIPKIDTLDGQKVYPKAEKQAEFPGGQLDFVRYLQRNLKYPENQEDLQSILRLTFIIDTFGNIRKPCVLKKYDPNYLSPFDSSVVAMFESMPRWVPAEMDGKKVYFRHVQSINVHLE